MPQIVLNSVINVTDMLLFLQKALSCPFYLIIKRYVTVWFERVEFDGVEWSMMHRLEDIKPVF